MVAMVAMVAMVFSSYAMAAPLETRPWLGSFGSENGGIAHTNSHLGLSENVGYIIFPMK